MWVCAVAWRRAAAKRGGEGFGEGPRDLQGIAGVALLRIFPKGFSSRKPLFLQGLQVTSSFCLREGRGGAGVAQPSSRGPGTPPPPVEVDTDGTLLRDTLLRERAGPERSPGARRSALQGGGTPAEVTEREAERQC